MLRSLAALTTCVALTACSPAAALPAESATPDVTAASPEAIRGVHNVGITVSDIDATIAFYSSAVTYEVVSRQRIAAASIPAEILSKRDGEIEIALIKTPTIFLRLIDLDPGSDAAPTSLPATGPGYTHICFQSPAEAPKYDAFKAIGLDILSRGPGPVDLGGYGVTYAYGFDPDGVMIEMEQVERRLIEGSGFMGQKRLEHDSWITHVANVTARKPEMVEFYRTILGYGPQREIPPTRRKTFDDVVDIDDIEIAASWFDLGNIQLELWHYVSPPTELNTKPRSLDPIGYNSFTFEVTDLVGTLARLEASGMSIAAQPFQMGDWTIVYLHDPEGNLVGFQQRQPDRMDLSIEDMRWFAETRPPEPKGS